MVRVASAAIITQAYTGVKQNYYDHTRKNVWHVTADYRVLRLGPFLAHIIKTAVLKSITTRLVKPGNLKEYIVVDIAFKKNRIA